MGRTAGRPILKRRNLDSLTYRDNPVAIARYLNAALSARDPVRIKKAIGVMVRAQGVAEFSQKTGMVRESLDRQFDGKTKPAFDTVLDVLVMLNIGLEAKPLPASRVQKAKPALKAPPPTEMT